MANITSDLTVRLKDDVTGKAKAISGALKAANDQVQALGKAGVSDRMAQQLSRLGLAAKDIDKVSASWKQYAASQNLAGRSADWTKSQIAQVRTWEQATISALRNVSRAQKDYARGDLADSHVQAFLRDRARPDRGFKHYVGLGDGVGRAGGAMAGMAAAGIAGYRGKQFGGKAVVSASEFDIGIRKQREFVDIPKALQDSLLTPQAKRIGQDTQFTNLDVVKAQTKAMQGLPAEFDAKLRAEVGAGIIESVKNYALVMEADLQTSAEAIRTFLQTTNKDISSKEKALAQSTRATNLLVKMAKLGGMNDEDVQQYMKYGAATGTAAGLSDTTLAALGAVGRRGGLRGDELGVFVRAISSKLVAPTRKGMDALTVAGIDYNKFTSMPGGLSVSNLEGLQKQRFGKGLTSDQRERLSDILEDGEIVGKRDEFTRQVTDILAESFGKTKGGKTRAQDQERLSKMVGDFHKLSTESVNAEGLLNAIMTNPKMSIALLNAMFTDKHGGKGSILASKWGEFGANKRELDKVEGDPDFAKRKADEIMGGLGGSFERLKGSIENLILSIGQAHESMLKIGMDKIGATLDKISDAPEKVRAWGSGIAGAGGALGGSMFLRSMAERMGWVGSGSGTIGLAGGLGIGAMTGLAFSDIAKDIVKENPEAAKALLDNSMLGAMSGDTALAAAILAGSNTTVAGGLNASRSAERVAAKDAWDAEIERRKQSPLLAPDVFKDGASPIQHLDKSAEAASAGQKTGAAYKSALGEQFSAAEKDAAAFIQRLGAILNHTFTPKVAPSFGALPTSAPAAPAGNKQALHADYGFDTV